MKNLVFLTGAGISEESGIKTFRGGNGLWDEYKVEDRIESYRNFYKGSKRERGLTKYTRRSLPMFLTPMIPQ